jgi:LuxR family maltose regulon positive regulatory protein
VPRPRLIERLNQGLISGRKLTLVSAPAGFGKTTLVSEWLAGCSQPAAWLSLDESDNDPTRFLAYFIAALQTVAANIGKGALGVLHAAQLQPPATESILTAIINDIAALPDPIVLVLDDYHLIDAQAVHDALAFLLEHLPSPPGGMHLVIATREDPPLTLARLRARDQLTELRAADLRFTSSEAAEFLNQVMGLGLSAEDIAALEHRTEGWIAGLQLAALALQGLAGRGPASPGTRQEHTDAASFVKSFTGSHRYVLDYLIEEVLQQQPESVQTFLLQTAILDRLCGPLCDAVLLAPSGSGQETLKTLEHANLFIVPLDEERRWYRYHNLFADLLRQRLRQSPPPLSSPPVGGTIAELHRRASVWYEENELTIQAFRHAAAADDVERAERLLQGEGMPLQFRGAMVPVMNWLASLPTTVLDDKPSLWVAYASALTMAGQPIDSVQEKLQAAEAAIASAADAEAAIASAADVEAASQRRRQDAEPDDRNRDLVGHIAAIRAMLAIPHDQVETVMAQSRRALTYLRPDNLPIRTTATWTLGYAYQRQGDRIAATQAYTQALSMSQASGNIMITLAATTGLGQVQETETQLHRAAESYRRGLQVASDPPLPASCAAYLGLARIFYEWNDLDAARQYAQQALQLARQIATVDTPAACEVSLARVKLAQGDVAGAAELLAKAEQFVRERRFVQRMPEVAAAQVSLSLCRGDLAAATDLAQKHALPLSQARVCLAQGDPGTALALLEPLRRQAEAKGLADERLRVTVLQAIAHREHGEKEKAAQMLTDALVLAEPGGFVRTFVDEGPPMGRLLYEALSTGIAVEYVRRLLTAFPAAGWEQASPPSASVTEPDLIEPLSERELQVLQLIAEGLTNAEIASRLFLSLHTIKVHARNIYGKLGVHNRTQAGAKARALGILPST